LSALTGALPVLGATVALLVVWQTVDVAFDVPTYILPSPIGIVQTVIANPALLATSLSVTLGEALAGFAIGSIVGLVLAIVLILIPILETALIPLVIAVNSVPSVAFVPLALIWFGLGMSSKIALGTFAVSFVVLLNGLSGIKRAEPDAINLLKSFGAGRLGILWRLQLPAAMPSVVTGLRIGLARASITVIVAEMLGAYTGLGQIIYQATAQVDTLLVWAAVFVASAGSLAAYGILVAIDQKCVWWK
jgi:NitT/TauT family transport system permease protein